MSDNQPLHEMAMWEAAWRMLNELKVKTVTISFDGSGDEGSINDIAAISDDVCPVSLNLPSGVVIEHDWQSDPATGRSLYGLIEYLSEQVLDSPGVPDWVNNEGGFGELVWYVPDRSLHLEVNVRVITSELEVFNYDQYGNETVETPAEAK